MSSDSVVVYRRSLVILCAREVTCPFRTPTKHAWPGRRLMCRAVRRAIIVGNSDGIGLALTRRLIDDGWSVTGLSRRAGPMTDHVVDVTAADNPDVLAGVGPAELCVYACRGAGGSARTGVAGAGAAPLDRAWFLTEFSQVRAAGL
jgi:hypothetical protein